MSLFEKHVVEGFGWRTLSPMAATYFGFSCFDDF